MCFYDPGLAQSDQFLLTDVDTVGDFGSLTVWSGALYRGAYWQ